MDRKVSVHVTEKRLSEVLDMVLHPMQLNYQVVGGQIIINSQDVKIPESEVAEVQTIKDQTVKGKVADENGAGLPGVNVFIKGTKKGVSTNGNGEFSISFPESNTVVLVFSSVGYVSQEVAVGNRSVINVSMVPDNKALTEVVVVGYGTQKKSDVTGSISSINDKAIKVPTSNIGSALQGRVAGLEIQRAGSTLVREIKFVFVASARSMVATTL
jgi:hypothetical protein